MNEKKQNKIVEFIKGFLSDYGIYLTVEPDDYGFNCTKKVVRIAKYENLLEEHKELKKQHKESNRKFGLLLKHLKLEYYRKEIKETNGAEQEYVEEGFRAIKNKK